MSTAEENKEVTGGNVNVDGEGGSSIGGPLLVLRHLLECWASDPSSTPRTVQSLEPECQKQIKFKVHPTSKTKTHR
jgi:hypothetical protein